MLKTKQLDHNLLTFSNQTENPILPTWDDATQENMEKTSTQPVIYPVKIQ